MRRMRIWMIGLVIVLVISLTSMAGVFSAPVDGYTLSKSSLEGGVFSWNSGGEYQLGGAIGEHEAGQVSGGEYQLGGGSWPGGEPIDQLQVFLPLIKK